MARLTWFDGEQMKELHIPDRGFITVGCGADDTARIDGPQISEHHLRIVSGPHGCMLTVLQGRSGVRVNERTIRSVFLNDGDLIQIGGQTLKYCAEEPPPSLLFPTEFETRTAPATGTLRQTPPGGQAYLRFVGGPARGHTVNIDLPLLGLRSDGVTPTAISRSADGYRLLILDPSQRVLLNGEPMQTKSRLLEDGDLIATGSHLVEFHRSDQSDPIAEEEKPPPLSKAS